MTIFAAATASAGVPVVPFTEDFDTGAADWRQADAVTDLAWNPAGGPDGGSFASGDFNFVATPPDADVAILRAQDEFGTNGSSGGAFVGNYLSSGVTQYSMSIRHNAPVPLTFFPRFATPDNAPAVSIIEFAPVVPGVWTEINFDIAFGLPNVFNEGPPTEAFFDGVFSDIGHVQIGLRTPAALAGQDVTYTFDVDKVTIAPEPTTGVLLGLAAVGLLGRRRRRG